MARPQTLSTPTRVNISIDGDLHAEARKYAAQNDMDFSEVVSRLLVAELTSKRGIARRFPRRLAVNTSHARRFKAGAANA